MTRFSTLHPDGTETNVREIKQSDMLACPHFIMVAEHYRDDGSCKCKGDDADTVAHQAMMVLEWGYSPSDFK